MLGIEFVVMPPEMRDMAEMHEHYALLITDVTKQAPEGLRKFARAGDVLWRVGRKDVTSRKSIAEGIVAACDFHDKWRAKGGHALRET